MHIQLQGVSKCYGETRVLDDIDLTVEEGEFVALLGPSGCGKTTLLSTLAGLVDIEQGVIEVGDAVWSKRGYTLSPEHRNVGMVFQDFALWPHMTVFENVAFGLRAKAKKLTATEIRNRVMRVLETVRMTAFTRHHPNQLSGGQKQRVAIARALAPKPSVMLMDEPLSSLDTKLREQMRWDLLTIMQEAKTTTIYVTHDQVEALSMADKVVLLNDGRIEQEGSPKSLYQEPVTEFSATFMGASNILSGRLVDHRDGIATVDCHGKMLKVACPEALNASVSILIRPADIGIQGDTVAPQLGTSWSGVVYQRAFLGTTWQYKVKLEGMPQLTLEVWESSELMVGTAVRVFFQPDRCRIVTANPPTERERCADY
jgi:ABC-type Fe3+/spermidine/putrescine transport system ATPase subunit